MIWTLLAYALGFVSGAYALGFALGMLSLLGGGDRRDGPRPVGPGDTKEVDDLRRDRLRWKRRALRRGWRPNQTWNNR